MLRLNVKCRLDEGTEHVVQRHATRIESAGDEGADVTGEQCGGEDHTASAVVAALEQLAGDWPVQTRAEIIGQENPDQQRINDPAIPARGSDDNAIFVSCRMPALAMKASAADVGGDHRGGDDVPGQLAIAEEISARSCPGHGVRPRNPDADGHDQISGEDPEVESVERAQAMARITWPPCDFFGIVRRGSRQSRRSSSGRCRLCRRKSVCVLPVCMVPSSSSRSPVNFLAQSAREPTDLDIEQGGCGGRWPAGRCRPAKSLGRGNSWTYSSHASR